MFSIYMFYHKNRFLKCIEDIQSLNIILLDPKVIKTPSTGLSGTQFSAVKSTGIPKAQH
jgi:hypothetical protein